MFERSSVGADPANREEAFKELLIAEGSDWFWWYGDDHSSEHDLEFDELFRRHLRNVYLMLGQPVPEELFSTNISTSHVAALVSPPVGLLNPILDGRATSYFEWLPAGIVETDAPAGTMTGGEHRDPELRALRFGFDLRHLYLRLDFGGPATPRLVQGLCCSVSFTTPADRRLVIRAAHGIAHAELHHKASDDAWVLLEGSNPKVAAAELLEVAIPFADLGLPPNTPFAFFVTIHNRSLELERHPANRPVEGVVPELAFEHLHWKA
jgi:hypothetical protein